MWVVPRLLVVAGGTWAVEPVVVPTGSVIITCCSDIAYGASDREASAEVVWLSPISSDDSVMLQEPESVASHIVGSPTFSSSLVREINS